MNEELITNESGVLPEDRKLIEEEPIITEIETELDWPETPTTDPTHDYQAVPKKYTDDQKTAAEVVAQAYTDGKLVVVPSDNLKLSSDAEVTGDNAVYTKLKEITSTVTGKIKTRFDLKQVNGPTGTIAGKIYINGVAVGEEHLQTLATYTTYEDASIDVVVGDLIQVYVMTVDSNRVQSIKNFRLYWDVSIPDYIDNALLPAITIFKNGTTTRAFDEATGSVNVAHGLGKTPKRVKVTAIKYVSTTDVTQSFGSWNSSGNNCVKIYLDAGNYLVGNNTKIVDIQDETTNPEVRSQSAILTVDGTNLIFAWTRTGTTSSGTIYILWEAEA